MGRSREKGIDGRGERWRWLTIRRANSVTTATSKPSARGKCRRFAACIGPKVKRERKRTKKKKKKRERERKRESGSND